jgi:hypothetical protein
VVCCIVGSDENSCAGRAIAGILELDVVEGAYVKSKRPSVADGSSAKLSGVLLLCELHAPWSSWANMLKDPR